MKWGSRWRTSGRAPHGLKAWIDQPAAISLRPRATSALTNGGLLAAEAPLLWAHGLSRSFTSSETTFSLVVDEIVLPRGMQVAVVGPSGCGKSTLLGLLSLALRPDYVSALTVAGVDAAALWQRGHIDSLTALRSRYIGFVPQTAALLPFLTLGENIALPQRIRGRPDPDLVHALARALGIDKLLLRRPAEVSVGERQRAAVARALAHQPPVLLADEPTASVHPAQADEILELLSQIATDLGTALLITTHDHDRARAAGFAIAPCRPDATCTTTHFAWAPRSPQPTESSRSGEDAIA
jgi:putative ABC transport system ATP-binding protein